MIHHPSTRRLVGALLERRRLATILGGTLLLAIALAACARPPSPTPVPTSAPTATEALPSTVVPAPTIVPTAVPTLALPTSTGTVTEVPMPSPTSVLSPTASPSLTPMGTIAPVGVMIDDDPHARPQTGMNQADVIYEVPAEFNLTRFLAIYFANAPAKVGSIRSTRPYFAVAMGEYGGGLIHCLDVPGVTAALATGSVFNFDMCHGAGEEGGIRTTDRIAPFNLYANAGLLQSELNQHPPRSAAALLTRAPLPSTASSAKTISITWPLGHTVDWSWNGQRYQRRQDGEPHLDTSGDAVATDVVIIQRTVIRPTSFFGEAGYHIVNLIGSGDAAIYANAQTLPVHWSRPSTSSSTIYTDVSGATVLLPPGRVFIEVLQLDGVVS